MKRGSYGAVTQHHVFGIFATYQGCDGGGVAGGAQLRAGHDGGGTVGVATGCTSVQFDGATGQVFDRQGFARVGGLNRICCFAEHSTGIISSSHGVGAGCTQSGVDFVHHVFGAAVDHISGDVVNGSVFGAGRGFLTVETHFQHKVVGAIAVERHLRHSGCRG